MEEIKAARIILEGEDGRRTTIEPGKILLELADQARLCLQINDEGAPSVMLAVDQGQTFVGMQASRDSVTGISVTDGGDASHLLARGLSLRLDDSQAFELTARGAQATAADGQLWTIPFAAVPNFQGLIKSVSNRFASALQTILGAYGSA